MRMRETHACTRLHGTLYGVIFAVFVLDDDHLSLSKRCASNLPEPTRPCKPTLSLETTGEISTWSHFHRATKYTPGNHGKQLSSNPSGRYR